MIFVRDIQAAVAEHYGIDVSDLCGPDARGMRIRKKSWPRQEAMYLASCLTTHSYSNIGRLFGGRDHSTVLQGIRSATERLKHEDTQGAIRSIARVVL